MRGVYRGIFVSMTCCGRYEFLAPGNDFNFTLLGLKPPALAGDFDFQYVDLCAISRVRVYDFSRLHPDALTHLLQ